MSNKDKLQNAAEAAKGKAKEATGDATDNRDLQAKGQAIGMPEQRYRYAGDAREVRKYGINIRQVHSDGVVLILADRTGRDPGRCCYGRERGAPHTRRWYIARVANRSLPRPAGS